MLLWKTPIEMDSGKLTIENYLGDDSASSLHYKMLK